MLEKLLQIPLANRLTLVAFHLACQARDALERWRAARVAVTPA